MNGQHPEYAKPETGPNPMPTPTTQRGEKPILFETAILRDTPPWVQRTTRLERRRQVYFCEIVDRCSTWEEAEEMHFKTVESCKAGSDGTA